MNFGAVLTPYSCIKKQIWINDKGKFFSKAVFTCYYLLCIIVWYENYGTLITCLVLYESAEKSFNN